MSRPIRAMMIGYRTIVIFAAAVWPKYARAGHIVKFLSMVDGGGGHHEMKRHEIAAGEKETEAVAKFAG